MADFNHHAGPQTGVKGVIADYQQAQLEQRQRQEQEAAAAKAAQPHYPAPQNVDQTLFTKKEHELSSDEDLDDLDDDSVFKEYREARLAELHQTGFGVLKDATPDEYVDMVDQHAQSDVSIVVVLVNTSRASKRLVEFMQAEVGTFTNTMFLCVQASECGFSDPHVVPIILGYRYGELKHNIVRVVDQFADPINFERQHVAKLLGKVCQ
ncbi:hypothetical protein LPJ77_003505 [Coemansia sp. RSA 2523]|nr:hypothetical protein LPJ54_003118 [Coemansia sp. RSA 1824]KAJ1806625.1 hypothetical protein LPJ77_003505 [Coemansia sp. RSA 2523]KAJ2152427.1 hypothetical protein GGH15_006121 [Coemansia sp. RSA 562]KAJ2211006.1 hypothetical protein IW143_004093 [Coemansia sp. RSA 520]KAJ2404219.1 hypothetical protein J3F80_005029 [Coemansia sp. RSA 2526]KAJ2523630.1 hypothetical protein GGH20_004203 [Coemansia sp. RSA 1937]KAJ2577540.1 hypothetical protein GGH19_001213 [Coemansia sp. RSA 1807]KAJ2717654.